MFCFPTGRAVAVVDTAALTENFHSLSAYVKQKKAANGAKNTVSPRMIAVVKANAYGHGADLAVPAFLSAGCDFFAVATPEEALEVRALAPKADILILGYTPPTEAAMLAACHITQTVFSAPYAAALSDAAQNACCRVAVHIKIDGGMCRLGFSPEDIRGIAHAVAHPGLHPTGLFTHFPSVDTDLEATRYALSRFLQCRDALKTKGFSFFCHAAASAAMLALPETLLDGVRPGLALYGIPPVPTSLLLRPAMSLCAPVVQIREVPTGTPVGYGGSHITVKPSRIGICPIGYGDGLWRGAEHISVTVLHQENSFFAPVAGHICMDQTMIDLTDTPVAVGDKTVFWADPRPLAAQLGTIPYEILTAVSRRVKRQKKGVSS